MLIRATLKYLPAQVLAPLAQLVSMVVWTHWLAPVQMGAYTLVVTTQELAYLACLSWFSVHALRSLPGGDPDPAVRQRYLDTENAVVVAASIVLALVAALFTLSLPDVESRWQAALAVAAFFVTRAFNAHYAERARAQSSYMAYTLLQSVGPIGGLALGMLALQFVEPTAAVLCASYALANLIGTLLALPSIGMTWRLRCPDPSMLRAALAFGGPMLGLSALGWVAENHLRYVVQWQSGAVALGLMAVGWGLGRRCASVASMLVTTAGFPIASRLLNEGLRAEAITQLGVNAAMLLAVTLPVSAALAFIGPAIVDLAVAPAYREATNAVLALSVISGVVRCLHVHITDQWLVLERRFGLAARVDVIEIVACGAASVAGLAWFGLQGAVAGQLLGSCVAFAASLWFATARAQFRWPWVDTGKVALATTAMCAALWWLGVDGGVMGIATAFVVGALVYGAALAGCYLSPVRGMVLRAVRRG